MKVPERLATFGIGVRGGDAAWCAVCQTPKGPDAEAKRAECVALRKAHLNRETEQMYVEGEGSNGRFDATQERRLGARITAGRAVPVVADQGRVAGADRESARDSAGVTPLPEVASPAPPAETPEAVERWRTLYRAVAWMVNDYIDWIPRFRPRHRRRHKQLREDSREGTKGATAAPFVI